MSSGGLAKGREALLKEFGSSIPQYTVDQFLTEVLPPLRSGMNVRKTLGKLRKGKTPAITNGRWSWFQEDPSQTGKHEHITFKPLEKIAEAIAKASGLDGTYSKLLDFKNNPNGEYLYERSVSTFRPDGYLVSTVQDGKIPWCDIALSAEYNSHNNEATRQEVMIRVAWSMRQCMREDPCRRFTYGLTIEDTQARLWFCSRGGALVSEPFNFITDCNIMVELFLRLMYAEKHEVGWDPTIERVKETAPDGNTQPHYDITMWTENSEKVTYRTIEVLSHVGANRLRGHGTRVWKVKKVVNGDTCGEALVLKDCWIDTDSPREGDIMREIRQSGSPDDEEFHDCLLTVVCHGDVKINDEPDDTSWLISRDGRQWEELLPDFEVEPELPCVVSWRHAYQYLYKTHYRIAFAEVCQPLYSLTCLNNIYQMLSMATRALQGLHERGWVHRDISTGNLLIYNGGIKLLDFEHARKVDDTKEHDVRIGTPNFIACEVEHGFYLFTPLKVVYDDSNNDDGSLNVRKQSSDEEATKPSSSSLDTGAFRYNPLHDLESLWWIANYFTFDKRIVRIGESFQSYDQTLQMEVANSMFYSRSDRSQALRSGTLTYDTCTLHNLIQRAARRTEFIRATLTQRYIEVEKDPQGICGTAANGLHEAMASTYLSIANKLPEDTFIGELEISKKKQTRVFSFQPRRSNRTRPGTTGQGQENDTGIDTGEEIESPVAADPDPTDIPKQNRTKQSKPKMQGSTKVQSTQGGEASSGPTTGSRKSARLAAAKKGNGSRLG